MMTAEWLARGDDGLELFSAKAELGKAIPPNKEAVKTAQATMDNPRADIPPLPFYPAQITYRPETPLHLFCHSEKDIVAPYGCSLSLRAIRHTSYVSGTNHK